MKKLTQLLMLSLVGVLFSGCALVDLSGTWYGTVDFTGGYCSGSSLEFTLDILQDGETVSGTVTMDGDDYSFTGTVSGMAFSLDGEEVSDEPWQSLELEGVAADESSASGSFTYFGDGTCTGTFTIERGEPVPQ